MKLKSLFLRRNERVKTTLSAFQVSEMNSEVHAKIDSTPENIEFCKEMEKLGKGRCWTVFAKTNGSHCTEYYSKTLKTTYCIIQTGSTAFRIGIEPWYLSRSFRTVESAIIWLTSIKLRHEVEKHGDLKLKKVWEF